VANCLDGIDPSDLFPGRRRKQWTSNRSSGEEDQPAVIDERIVGALKITSEYQGLEFVIETYDWIAFRYF